MKRVPFGRLLASDAEVAVLRDALAAGGVIALPTETFYGLAADPRNSGGVDRVFEVKGRPRQKALPVLLADREQLEELGVEAPTALLDRFCALWPAPLTVIFPLRQPVAASGGDRSLAVRIPAHGDLRSLLRQTGPLTGTSANPSGMPPLSDPNEVALAFGDRIDLLIDGGPTSGQKPSTLVDARFEPPRVIRQGAYPWPPPNRPEDRG